MFYSVKHKVLLIGFVFLIVSIPAGSLLLSHRFKASTPIDKIFDRSLTNASSPVPKTLPITINPSSSPTSNQSSSSSDDGQTFGPNLKLSVKLEGRTSDQSGKFFVGIAQGTVTANPTYLLTFSINVPQSGIYETLSLVGLNVGAQYTAYVKGPSQIAKGSTFSLTPTGATLNSGQPLILISGDINEDNIIDAADLSLVTKLAGTTSTDSGWNPLADINLDGAVNSIDIQIVKSNQGKTGDGGAWYSRAPEASSSASVGGLSQPDLTFPLEGTPGTPNLKGGYWIYVPAN
jgi:hypothetical protein